MTLGSRGTPAAVPVTILLLLERRPIGTEGFSLQSRQLNDSLRGEVQLLIQQFSRERFSFGGALDFNELSCPGHHHIQIDFGCTVFLIVEVHDRTSVDNSHTDGRDTSFNDPAIGGKFTPNRCDSVAESDEAARNAQRSRPTVSFEDIAIDRNCSRA